VTDADRIRRAEQRGSYMYGPLERQRCGRHSTRWETYQWRWPFGGLPEQGEPLYVRTCEACADEYDDQFDDE